METSGYWTQMWLGTLEGLTDLNYDNVGYSGLAKVYYPGNYNASIEDRKVHILRDRELNVVLTMLIRICGQVSVTLGFFMKMLIVYLIWMQLKNLA